MTPKGFPNNGPTRIPNDKLREAFHRSGLTSTEVAVRAGWLRATRINSGDGDKVNILLGLRPNTSVKKGLSYQSVRQTLSVDDAMALADALRLDPHEIGA